MPLSQATLDFMTENRFEDSLDWFHAHKREYENLVLAPLAALVEELAPVMRSLDPGLIVEPRVDRCISRIYRDTRFSKDKFRYRDVMWIVFMRDKKLYHGPPAFFFEFSPRGFRHGCGYYQARPEVMAAGRALILKNAPVFRKARRILEAPSPFSLEGDAYKRTRHADRTQALRAWLDRKNWYVVRQGTDPSIVFAPDWGRVLAEDFTRLKPVYDFFCAAEARARS